MNDIDPIPELPCDDCGVLHRTPHVAFVCATNMRERALCRIWGFCSATCRDSFFDAGSAADFLPILPAHDPLVASFVEGDGEIHLLIVHYDGFEDARGERGVSFGNPDNSRPFFTFARGYPALGLVLRSPADVNAWWRAPAAARVVDAVPFGLILREAA